MKMFRMLAVFMMAVGLNAFGQDPSVTKGDNASVVAPSVTHENRGRIAAATVRTNPVIMTVTASRGPLKKDTVNYTAFEADFMSVMFGLSKPVGAPTTNKFIPLGNVLTPSYLVAPTVAGTPVIANTLWFAVEMSSKQPFMVPSNLGVVMKSSPNNIFGETLSFMDTATATQVYDGQSGAEVWNADGTTNRIISGFWYNQPVNRFFFLGKAAGTLDANTQAVAESNIQWMLDFSNFSLMATYSFTEGDVTTTATKVLETHPATVITLQIARSSSPGKAVLTPKGLVGTGSILGKAKLSDSGWALVAKVTGPTPVEVLDSSGMQFFRLTVD